MANPGEIVTVQRPEMEAFERCLIQAIPPRNRFHFLPPNLYLKKRDQWLRAIPGFLLLFATLLTLYLLHRPVPRIPCDYSIPDFHLLPEQTQHLFIARRARAVPDTSPHLQSILATCRKANSETATLLRFYLIYDPILNPNHLASRPASDQLRSRVRDGLNEVKTLPVSKTLRAALTARFLTAEWILNTSDTTLTRAWDATEVPELRTTCDQLDLQLFILHHLLDQSFFADAIVFQGEKRPRHAIEALYKRLAKERNTLQEVTP